MRTDQPPTPGLSATLREPPGRKTAPARTPVRAGRGPRLGTKLALLGLPLALVVVPLLSSVLLAQMERWSVQWQSEQQRRIAEGIAVSFYGRDDLFADLPVNLGEYDTLEARHIQKQPRLDGAIDDWGDQAMPPVRFGAAGEDGSFALRLGTRPGMLYAYLEIVDDARVYRDPAVLRLDNADQVRVGFLQPDGEDGRIVVTLSPTGDTTAYRMDSDWRFAQIGPPESAVRGFARETPSGYRVELRLPFSLLGSRRYFGLAFVDVDDADTRAIRATTQTYAESLLLAFRSPELSTMLESLDRSDMEVLVLDAERRLRAKVGSYRADQPRQPSWQMRLLGWPTALADVLATVNEGVWRWFAGGDGQTAQAEDAEDAQGVEDRVVASALSGTPIALPRRAEGVRTILAGHPIRSERDAVIGTITVEQNINDILAFKREAMDQIALASLATVLVVPLFLVAFAGRLTWRIRGLRRAAAAAIDEHGRLRTTVLGAGVQAADEIGDLARSIAAMLARLDRHHAFVRTMPRTLRHEIHNPLNTLTTSLEHLARNAARPGSKYLESAERAVLRIGAIVQNLTDAANLEDSLTAEELEIIDIQGLVHSYVNNCRATHGEQRFVFHSAPGPVYAEVADYRIEQMLDKLIDNAVDFHRAGSPITVCFSVRRDDWVVTVANRGPNLAADPGALFESLVSRRTPESKSHFGLGLYVVRVIAEQHGGSARAVNLVDGSGVAVTVRLPLAGIGQRADAERARNGAAESAGAAVA